MRRSAIAGSPRPTWYPGRGAVGVGISNSDNKPLNGGINPMMQMTTLYILETAP